MPESRSKLKHRKLSPKARHATKQAQSLTAHLHTGLSAPKATGHVNVNASTRELHASLESMRHALSHSRNPKKRLAAQGLAELQTSIAKLAQANAHKNPSEASRLLYEGFKALERSRKRAKQAGNAWPL